MSETVDYNGVMPYTDRLNYVSPLINNMGYCMAVEKALGITVPDRCHYIRVIISEISRITDHLTCVGASAMELGAFTVFLYMIKAREYLWELVEKVTGARLTVSYCRVGGVKGDLPEDFAEQCRKAIEETRKVLKESDALLTRNRIFVDRMIGTGVISAEDAICLRNHRPFPSRFRLRTTTCARTARTRSTIGSTSTCRSGRAGTTWIVISSAWRRWTSRCGCRAGAPATYLRVRSRSIPRRDAPIPAAEMVDLAKMGNIVQIAGDAAVTDPTLDGSSEAEHSSIATDEKRVFLPAKEDTYGNIEGLMKHFKLVMFGHGVRPPKGEVYFPVEGANGELGFYVVSDGTSNPYRVRVRPPCFAIMSALPKLLVGDMIADMIPTFGSVNMIGGELDR